MNEKILKLFKDGWNVVKDIQAKSGMDNTSFNKLVIQLIKDGYLLSSVQEINGKKSLVLRRIK